MMLGRVLSGCEGGTGSSRGVCDHVVGKRHLFGIWICDELLNALAICSSLHSEHHVQLLERDKTERWMSFKAT